MAKPLTDPELLAIARTVIKTEADALLQVSTQLDNALVQAAKMIFATKGHCVVSGIGKSGHIGRKIAASFSSTGTPSFFIHPTEASHGDLGMIGTDACVLAISNSGETKELRDLILHCRDRKITLVAITRNPNSFLGRNADVIIRLIDVPEACPNGLAPTTSTTACLAIGDALTVTIMHLRGVSTEDFGQWHPGGSLGLQLQKAGTYLLERNAPVPMVHGHSLGREVVQAITEGRQGCVAVIDAHGLFVGMITDGDLRRAMEQDFFDKTAMQIMTKNPTTAVPEQRMSELIHVMTTNRIANLFVIDAGAPIGLVHIKDLMESGYL